MAAETRIENTEPGKNAMDYAEHERTYALFLGLSKWVVIGAAAIVIFLAVFVKGPPRHPGAPAGQAPAGQAAAH